MREKEAYLLDLACQGLEEKDEDGWEGALPAGGLECSAEEKKHASWAWITKHWDKDKMSDMKVEKGLRN